MEKSWHHYKYKNLSIFAVSLILAGLLLTAEAFRTILIGVGSWGYVGAFLGGMMFVSTFTIAIGAAVLVVLTGYLSALEIALLAGLGAVLTDFTVFKLVKDGLVKELTILYDHFGGKHLTHILHTKYFSWSLPLIGAAIIASPLPDELGVTLMGLSKMTDYKFLVLSFLLNFLGIFLIVSAAATFKH